MAVITNIYPVPGTDTKALGIIDDGIERFVSEGQPDWETIQTYIKEHPEVVSDPPPPPDTRDFEMQSQAEAQRQALFSEYDKKVLQYQREVRLGMTGAEARLAAWDAYAEALRAVNNTEGWFRDPQWPPKPEV
jgi:hypothetical protein